MLDSEDRTPDNSSEDITSPDGEFDEAWGNNEEAEQLRERVADYFNELGHKTAEQTVGRLVRPFEVVKDSIRLARLIKRRAPESEHEQAESEIEIVPPGNATESMHNEQGGDEQSKDQPGESTTASNLTPEMIDMANKHRLRIEAVDRALKRGFKDPVGFLVKVRENQDTKKRWETLLGIDLSTPPPKENRESQNDHAVGPMDHPYWELNRQGQARAAEIVETAKDVGSNRRKAKGQLKRVSPPIPGVRKIHQHLLARKMLQHHKDTRKKQDDRTGDPMLYNDGLLGMGSSKKRSYRKRIRKLENSIAVERGALGILSHHELKGLQTDRSRAAERILRLKSLRDAVRKGESIPEDFYQKSAYKNAVDEYDEKVKLREDKG